MGILVCGYVDVGLLRSMPTEELLFSLTVQHWALATWSLSIATQVSATLLIAWKVWYTHIGTVGPHKSQKSLSIMWIILESGAVLSLGHIFLLAFYVHKITAGGVLVAMIGQLDVSTVSLGRHLRSPLTVFPRRSSRRRCWSGSP